MPQEYNIHQVISKCGDYRKVIPAARKVVGTMRDGQMMWTQDEIKKIKDQMEENGE